MAKKKTSVVKKMRPQKMKPYSSFADWKRDQSLKNRKLVTLLSSLVEITAPDFSPTVKWGQGCWTLDGNQKIFIHAEPDHLQFGFFAGSKLKDPSKLLEGNGKYVRHVKVYTQKDISTKAISALIKQVLKP